MTLHIEKRGKGNALVFFHGWGFDNQIWLKLALAMEDSFTLYLVDLPGFGLSSMMEWNSFKQELLQHLPEHFAIIGWSMGGLFAMRLALEETTRSTHLISVCSSPRFIREKSWPGIDKIVLDDFYQNLAKNSDLTLAQFVRLQMGDEFFYPDKPLKPSSDSLKYGLDILANWDLREALHNFSKPACFIFGRLDMITPRSTGAAMQKIYPKFSYQIFEKAAHMPFLSHQQEFIACLEQVLK
ncbi:MAG: alpha/beta fold hydrolase [Tatlockia sp.]|nr:alpha/beta fold hydrolase [Tatlockia sp.]